MAPKTGFASLTPKVVAAMFDGGVSRLLRNGVVVWTETWTGSGWRKGGTLISEFRTSPPPSPEILAKLGVPPEDVVITGY
jgi:hypothetical protein